MSINQSEKMNPFYFKISPALKEVFPYVESQKFDLAIGQLTYQIFAIQEQIQDILKQNGIADIDKQTNSLRGIRIQPQSSMKIEAKSMQVNENQVKIKNPINNMLSMLYLNRGILEFCKGRISEALTDLQKSLAFNYLNYCAYFNSHSIYFRMYQAFKASGVSNKKIELQFLEQSMNDIGCALSCLYLLYSCLCKKKGQSIQEEYLDKAIKYCGNNIDARLKKAFLLYSREQFKNCNKMLNWIVQIGGQQKIQKIRDKIHESSIKSNDDKSISNIEWMQPKKQTFMQFRLNYDQIYEKKDIPQREQFLLEQITQKQIQFINIYDQINRNENSNVKMGILRKVKVNLKKSMNMKSSQQNSDKQTNLYLLSRDFPPVMFEDEENQPQKNQKYQNQLRKSKSVNINDSLNNFVELSHIQIKDDEHIKSYQQPNAKNPQQISSSSAQKYHFISQKHSEPDFQSQNQLTKQKKYNNQINYGDLQMSENVEKSMSEIQSSVIQSSSLMLQPLDQQKHLGISVFKVDLIVPQQEKKKLKSLYCIFQYDDKFFKSILIGQDYSNQIWDDQLEVPLGDEPKQLIVKIYQKEVLAFGDRCFGMGSKQIIMTGRIQVPIYNSEKDTGKVIIDIKYK